MSDTPHVPASDEVAWLRARVAELEDLNARLREAAAARDELAAAQLAARDAQIAALAALAEELRRRLDKDSSTSLKPPSSDSPYKKKPRDRSLRGRSGRRPGKQPGAQSSTLEQSPHPDDTVLCGPAACGCCGHDLTGEPVLGTVQKRQVFEASPPPPPTVTEYQVAAKQCPECGEVSVGLAPAGVTGRVQYGPLVHAKAALAVCAHYLPVARAARLVAALTGVNVSAGFVAGIRGKAARLLAPFMNRVRELLPAAPVLYADETPARAAGKLHYVHVACTEFLTAMHTGDRTSEAIDAGGILPGYPGTIVRDGYKGYEHLTSALHAWCGAHGLRDLAGLYRSGPESQVWARSMADLLIDANGTATAARSAGQASLSDAWPHRHPVLVPRRRRQGHRRQPAQAHPDGQRRAAPGPPVPRPRGHDPPLRHRPDRRIHLQPGRTRHPPGQGPAAHLRRDLAHPARPSRLRDRPVLPVHRRQMGHRRPRRPHPAIHRRPLAPARNRAPIAPRRIAAPTTRTRRRAHPTSAGNLVRPQ